mgnify:FL=1
MVSRRTFAVITMLMAIILFLFQGLNLAKEKLNHYEKMRMRQRKKIWKMAAAHLEQKTHPARKT